MAITYEWRGGFDNREINQLHSEAFAHPPLDVDWWERVNRHSLGWVSARQHGPLVGFVNVIWDGGVHAFLLDTAVAAPLRRRGLGARLVMVAVGAARAAGCQWLHVDYAPHLHRFYIDACGFQPTGAGLIALQR
jgi:GNAT superfamily N-acetyltransferase